MDGPANAKIRVDYRESRRQHTFQFIGLRSGFVGLIRQGRMIIFILAYQLLSQWEFAE